MIKRYNIIKALEEPVGTKFISTFYSGEWEVKKNKKGYKILVNEEGKQMTMDSFYTNLIYEKAPLSFKEVMYAISDNEEKDRKKKITVTVVHESVKEILKEEFFSINALLEILAKCLHEGDITGVIINGRWYIEED